MYTPSSQENLTILIADDHPAIRMVLKDLIKKNLNNTKGIFETDSIAGIYKLLKERSYHLAILDLHLEDGILISELLNIRRSFPEMKTLIFSMYPENLYAQRAISLGADGFVNKKAAEAEIHEAIRKVLAGRKYLNADFMISTIFKMENAQQQLETNPFEQLTAREFEVVGLILRGKSNKEISSVINLSPSTISSHRVRIYQKLNIQNEIELSQLASVHNLTNFQE